MYKIINRLMTLAFFFPSRGRKPISKSPFRNGSFSRGMYVYVCLYAVHVKPPDFFFYSFFIFYCCWFLCALWLVILSCRYVGTQHACSANGIWFSTGAQMPSIMFIQWELIIPISLCTCCSRMLCHFIDSIIRKCVFSSVSISNKIYDGGRWGCRCCLRTLQEIGFLIRSVINLCPTIVYI